MAKLSAFADEVSDSLNEQIRILKSEDVGNIELRGVEGKKVLQLSGKEAKEIKRQASEAGVGFSAVATGLGKFPLDGKLEDQLDDLKIALEHAAILEAPYIRLFSFHIPKGDDPAAHRTQVMDWLGAMIEEAEKTPVVLAHENEKGIYGDTGKRCLDLYENLKSKNFTGIFDFANFVQCGEKPYQDCWPILRKHTRYFHVKDARLKDGKVTPAGKGDGDVEKILTEAFAAGFDDFLTLEPHLSVAETSYGETTPDLFHVATESLKDILSRVEK